MDYIKQKNHRHGVILFILIFGLILLGLYMVDTYRETNVVIPAQQNIQDTTERYVENIDVQSYQSLIQNSQIIVPDTDMQVSLVDGRASYGTLQEGGDVSVSRVLGVVRVSEDIQHVFADIAVQSGGTGVFHYVGLFEVGKNKVTHLASTFVDDRVVLEKVMMISSTKDSYFVEIDFLGRDSEQALTEEPVVNKKLIREVKKNAFVEVEPVAY